MENQMEKQNCEKLKLQRKRSKRKPLGKYGNGKHDNVQKKVPRVGLEPTLYRF